MFDYDYRKERDPLKPKQPMSAFFLFSNERRASLLAENKNVLEVTEWTRSQFIKLMFS